MVSDMFKYLKSAVAGIALVGLGLLTPAMAQSAAEMSVRMTQLEDQVRLLMGQGARSPLKHTVDVPPMSKRTVEFEANEAKDWMFHCHILYHMMSGMARVFRYED